MTLLKEYALKSLCTSKSKITDLVNRCLLFQLPQMEGVSGLTLYQRRKHYPVPEIFGARPIDIAVTPVKINADRLTRRAVVI